MSPYADRRAQLRATMGKNAAALLASPSTSLRNADNEYRYRANSDVVYLSAFDEPETVLLVLPDDHPTPFVMFVQPRDPSKEVWTGLRAGIEGARERFGADAAFPVDELEGKLMELLEPIETLYLPFEGAPGLFSTAQQAIHALRHRKNHPVAGPRSLVDLRLILASMRRIKSSAEIEIMREAARISGLGHRAALETIAPGVGEWQVEAAINHAFRNAGANGPAYETIVGSGANATILHYIANDSVIRERQTVLIDAGAEYRYYSGDITRTYPSSGRFEPAQRDLYEIVLEAEKRAIEACLPGAHVRSAHEVAVRIITEGLVELGLLAGDPAELIETEAFKRYFMHGTSHYLGLDTHDAGEYFFPDGSAMPMEPGMVLTVEPGIYVAADDTNAPERFRGIGIRIEDDILVTEDGFENLTSDTPKELADIEK